MIVHAPLQFPKGIKYKIYCSGEAPEESFKETEVRIYNSAPKKKPTRKKISAFIRNSLRDAGVSRILKKTGLQREKIKKPKLTEEKELVTTLQYCLKKFCPSCEFMGFAKEISDEDINSHKIVLAQSNWPIVKEELNRSGWNNKNIIVMPIPESDYWGYWNNLYLFHANKMGQPDVGKTINSDVFPYYLLKNKIITNDKRPLKLRKKKNLSKRGLEKNTHVYPYPSFETDLIAANKGKIDKVFENLSGKKSKEIYHMVLYGTPEQRWEYYINNTLSNQQYFEHINLKPGDVIINVGLDNGFELPFFCAHMDGKGKIYNLDPFGFKFISPYVRETIKYFPEILEENIAVVCDKNQKNAPKSEIIDFGSAPAVTIDGFVKSKNLEKVDLIKMDIEAMEELAVPHMMETVKKFRPQLAIAVYHKPEHFWDLPNLIIDNCKDYEFFFNIYSSSHFEGIFYAIPKERLKTKKSL